jgi:predicted extracellular nuclease
VRPTLRSALVLAASAAVVSSGLAATPAAAVGSPDLVISQVYGGGGNSGSTWNNDFVELFNRGSSPVSLTGMSVQYASAAGGSWAVTALTGTVAPGQYYLVQEAAGTSGGTIALPTADTTGTINLSGTSGKVALATVTAALGCGANCHGVAGVVDYIGYGTATDFEGHVAPGPSVVTQSDQRASGGCQDTDDNGADFTVADAAPRNTASPVHSCTVVDTPPAVIAKTPAAGATGVDETANVSVTFSEPVSTSDPWLTLSCNGTDEALDITGGPTTWTGNPTADLPSSTQCTATVHAAGVADQDGTADHPALDTVWSFTTAGALVPIHDIQGAAHRSSLTGQTVRTSGVVTAKRSNGFWLQDPAPDADPATSEGVFVFTSSAPTVAVGDSARVSARVQEFRPSSATGPNLTVTELSSVADVTVVSTGNPLPEATIVGAGGRIPPNQVIEDDATGSVETSGVFDPATDGIDFWESLEGMRIQLNDAVAVGPTNAGFGETPVVGDDGTNAGVRSVRGGVVISPDDFNPERITVADDLTPLPSLNVGDHYSGPLVGVEDYNFGLYMLQVTDPVSRIDDGLARETTDASAGDQLSAATFNVENLDPSDGAAKFDRLAHIVVDNMRAPDLISVEEVQDNNGATDNGVVAADVTMQTLIQAIQAAGGPQYDYREIDPVNDQDGGEPGGNIRVVLMFRPDVGLSFVDRPGGSSTSGTAVVDGTDGPQLSFSPGRIDPTSTAWSSSRKPLAAELMYRGRHLFAIGNHFNSKGGDNPLLGRFQPPVRSSETQRHQQATLVHDFVGQILAKDANADVVVMGDLNDFEFSDTVSILKGSTLHDLVETLPKAERYSYDFEGNSQVLDHVLVSDHLFTGPHAVDVVHVNAEFADQASDHDPTVVRMTFESAPTVDAGGPYTVDEGSSTTLSATADDAEGDDVSYAWDLDGNGTYETSGQSVLFDAASIDGPATRTVSVQATDAFGQSSTASATIQVRNVAPTVDAVTPGPHAACGTASTISVAWHDPAPADTVAVTIGWGDGTTSTLPPASASPVSAQHTYAKAGAYQVSVDVSDDDGGAAPTTWSTLVLDYSTGGLVAPWTDGSLTANVGSKVPLKAVFVDCDGSRPSTVAPTYDVQAAGGGPVLTSGSLRWDGEKYVAQLDTSALPGAGTYLVTVTVPATGQTVVGTLRLR